MHTADAKQLDRKDRLRAALRLCFRADEADALSATAANDSDPVRRLGPVVRRARLRFTAVRWLAALPSGRRAPGPPLPLGPRRGLPALPALALALHLGLDLDAETLGQLLDRSPEQIGLVLGRARQAVDPNLPAPYPEFAAAIGRYRDRLDPQEVLPLLRHLGGCARCQAALAGARAVDDALLATIERTVTELPDTPEQRARRTLWLRPALGVAGVILVLALMGVVLVGANWLLSTTAHHPVPLLPASAPGVQHRGWLLEAGQGGEIEAFDLATGARRVLISGQPDAMTPGNGSKTLLSPDHRTVVQAVTVSSALTLHVREYTLAGVLLHRWRISFAAQDSLQVLGWLNADVLLVARIPADLRVPGQTQQQYRVHAATHSQLLDLDVRTGTVRVLLPEDIDAAAASPDGQAIAVTRVTANGSAILELRSIRANGALGPPTATFAGNVSGSMVWTPDSRQVVFAAPPVMPMTGESAIDALSLTGQLTTIMRLPSSLPTNLGGSVPIVYNVIGVTPDGTHVIYGDGASYWEVSLTGGPPRQLVSSTTGSPGYGATLVWSPNAAAMALTVSELPQTAAGIIAPGSYITLTFAPTGRPLGALLDQFTYPQLLAWLPEDALPAGPATPTLPGTFAAARATPDLGSPQPMLTAVSRLSPDGTQALIVDRSYGLALAIPLDASPPVPVTVGAPDETSWLPDGSGAIGVQPQNTGSGTSSRIAVYTPAPVQINGGVVRAPADFDPAGLGASTTARYARPLVAPDGLHDSFFVVDGRAIALWLGGRNAPPTVVARWVLPANARVTPLLLASWVSSDALVFSEPGGWANGLPQHFTLECMTIMPNGTATIAPLVGWHAQGGEQGIALQALRRSPDGTRLAVRLRHYTGTNPTTDRFDAIVVLPASDLTQGVELARGGVGAGLSWSPSGGELVAALGGGLVVFSADGSHVEHVPTGGEAVSYPLWVAPNTIWYEAGSGASAQVHQVVR